MFLKRPKNRWQSSDYVENTLSMNSKDPSVYCQSLSTDVPQYIDSLTDIFSLGRCSTNNFFRYLSNTQIIKYSHRYILVGVMLNQQFLQVFYGREVLTLPIPAKHNTYADANAAIPNISIKYFCQYVQSTILMQMPMWLFRITALNTFANMCKAQ